MKAIILVGGFGTRLQSVLPDVPKPMAPIMEKPFLAYLLDYLQSQGITHVIFPVHYMREKIQEYFQSDYHHLTIQYVVEEKPLGTGGAIKNALAHFPSTEPIFVLNGDTFVKLDYQAMRAQHIKHQAALTIALRAVDDCGRYGKVMIENDVITAFREKGEAGSGHINAGVYLINPELFSHHNMPEQFSFEKDFLVPYAATLKPRAFIANDYFIDIGIPEDYARAVKDFSVPKISIIMPVLNSEKTIEKAILSVINQNYKNLEFIIIDGGSTDNTVTIIKRYEKYLAYWHSQPDGSPTIAVNFALQKATGDLIALFMSDDWYENGTLHKIGAALTADPDADMITCGGRIMRLDERTKSYKVVKSFATARLLKLSFYNICFASSAICCRFIRKSFYERMGDYIVFDDNGKHIFSNDKELLLRAAQHHAKDVFIKHLGLNYFSHHGSSTFGNHRRNAIRLCEEHLMLAEMFLKKKDLSLGQRLLLRFWHNDQSARLFLFRLLESDFRSAMKVAKQGLRKYNLIWPAVFCFTVGGILVRRGWKALSLRGA